MNFELNMILAYGVTFGILLMTVIYTFIRYIYSKELLYISYSFMQLFSLIYIINYSKLFGEKSLYMEFSLLLASMSAIVFSTAFYSGKFLPSVKNYKELIINTFLLNVVILTSFYHYILFEYLPYTIIYFILFVSIIFNLKSKSAPVLIYVLGWSFFCFVLFVLDFKSFYIENSDYDIVLVAFAIEAVLFTLSISYQYGTLKNQTKEYQNMLFQQSKFVKSGEMIGNITHQFRQPLNNISYILINIKKRFEKKELSQEYFDNKFNQANQQLQFLSKTIDDFKEFYTLSKTKEIFRVKEPIENSLAILMPELKRQNIEVSVVFNVDSDIKVYGIKNELAQVIFSIVSNSADALKQKANPKIKICVDSNIAEVVINISDNGIGIKKQDIEKIFDAYYSTKKDGSGIGLYLSKMIIENSFAGKIEVQNQKEGVKFSLFLEKAI